MGERELFTLAVAIASVLIIGRTVASRLEVTEGLLQPASRASGAIFWRTVVFPLESSLFVERPTLIFLAACVLIVTLSGQRLAREPRSGQGSRAARTRS